MQTFIVLLIPALIAWAWIAPIGFANRQVEGSILQVRPLPLLARIKRHVVPHAIAMVIAAALAVSVTASAWWLVAVVASFAAILALPQSYVVTTRGIRTGRGNFRRWTEFAGVYRSPAGVTLQTIGRLPNVPIWLARTRGDDEFVHLLRTLVRDSYKGKLIDRPVPQGPERSTLETAGMETIAAFHRHQ